MSDDLAARVLAAIEAKEAKARAATRGPWRVDETGFGVKQRMLPGELSGYAETVVLGAVQGNYHTEPEDAAFIADNDPVDVLRRCAKDREIVALTAVVDRDKRGNFLCRDPSDEALLDVLIALAEGYGIEVGT